MLCGGSGGDVEEIAEEDVRAEADTEVRGEGEEKGVGEKEPAHPGETERDLIAAPVSVPADDADVAFRGVGQSGERGKEGGTGADNVVVVKAAAAVLTLPSLRDMTALPST